MDTKDAQDLMRRLYLDRDRETGVEGVLLRTFEELEELKDAILKEREIGDIEGEVADVFAWICSLANLLDIDLSDALLKKYPNACSRCGNLPCQCGQ